MRMLPTVVLKSLEYDQIMDESSNVRHARICNISIHSEHDSLHYISEDIHAKQMTAVEAAKWLRNHLIGLSNEDLTRIKSITTDTCQLMFNIWAEVQNFNDF